jgi:hypothetical protein
MVAFEMWVEAIMNNVEEDEYEAREKAYRGVMEKLGHHKKDIED